MYAPFPCDCFMTILENAPGSPETTLANCRTNLALLSAPVVAAGALVGHLDLSPHHHAHNDENHSN